MHRHAADIPGCSTVHQRRPSVKPATTAYHGAAHCGARYAKRFEPPPASGPARRALMSATNSDATRERACRNATRELSVASFPRRTPPPAPSVSSEIRSVRRAPPCLAPIFASVPYFPHFLSPAIYNTQDGLIYRIPQGQIRESTPVSQTQCGEITATAIFGLRVPQ